MILDALAKYYALKQVSRLRRFAQHLSLHAARSYGFELSPFYLARLENALQDGWPQYETFVGAHAGDVKLRRTVEAVLDEMRSEHSVLRSLAAGVVDLPLGVAASFASPILWVMDLLLGFVSRLGLHSAVVRRATRRLTAPLYHKSELQWVGIP